MKPKKLVTAALLIFVAGSLGYMVVRENKPVAKTTTEIKQQAEPNQQVMVYYFHGDVRCPTCHKLEQYAKEAVDTYFAQDLASDKIKWMPTNIDTAGNEHFVKDYQLVTKSVILSKVVDGQQIVWKNLDQIWDLVSDKEKYLAYIRDNVAKFTSEEQK
jgi:hypothetical protein